MKKIRLVNSTKEDNSYHVYLGNGTAHKFTSRKSAQKFLCQTSDYLTHKLYDLHYIFIEVSEHYHNNWCYFPPAGSADKYCRAMLDTCQKCFDLSIERCGYTNGNHFVFSHLKNIAHELKHIIKMLEALNENRGKRKELYAYRSLIDRIIRIENDLSNYTQSTCMYVFKVPVDLDLQQNEYIPKMQVA